MTCSTHKLQEDSRPKVSIGMPVYNGQDFLVGAIESVLRQTFTDFELIISDNCSDDDTGKICQAYAARDSRIRYVRQSVNLGAVENFNIVVTLARGEYFKWAAHDDLMEPAFLQRCVEALDRDPAVAWCHTKSDMIDATGRSFRDLLPSDDEELTRDSDGNLVWAGIPRNDHGSDDPIARFRGVILGTNWCVDSYGLYRLSVLRETQLFLPFYGAEKPMIGEVSLRGKFYEVPELLFYQRVHDKASGSLESPEELAQFVASNRKKHRFFSTRWIIFQAHLSAVSRAPLTRWQKIRGWMVGVHYLFQFRKWRRVVPDLLAGRGNGGGGMRVLKSAQRNKSNLTKAMQAQSVQVRKPLFTK